MSQQEVH